ncbi:heme ABC transporter ATP-binding protein [Parasalinivibrio latis]|uniref:heme ABC transporter ATP-binding protein n=1 Tax=Parasalinivibrio latis TaxID=2952610 RepID=UPI0030E074D4
MHNTMPNETKLPLEVFGLTIRQGRKKLIDNITLGIKPGELVAIIGPNGAGKSTLLSQVMSNQHTNVAFWGTPRKSWMPEHLARHVAMLPQHSSLNFPFTVREVVEMGGYPLKLPRHKLTPLVHSAMDKTGIAPLSSRSFPSLSGGEKQRCQLARLFVQLSLTEGKNMLLLDEPTSALDLHHQHSLLNTLQSIAIQGCAVIAVLHDLNLVARYADRVIVMDNGKLVMDGSPWEVMTSNKLAEIYHCKFDISSHPRLATPVLSVN